MSSKTMFVLKSKLFMLSLVCPEVISIRLFKTISIFSVMISAFPVILLKTDSPGLIKSLGLRILDLFVPPTNSTSFSPVIPTAEIVAFTSSLIMVPSLTDTSTITSVTSSAEKIMDSILPMRIP